MLILKAVINLLKNYPGVTPNALAILENGG
jgi:hypothetical protein